MGLTGSTESQNQSKILVRISRRHVNICEAFWKKASVTWEHKTAKNMKLLENVTDAHNYIKGIASTWHIDTKPGGPEFIQTLLLNAEISGKSGSEYMEVEYKIGGKDGKATYIYVIVGHEDNKILVAFSYHYLNESLTDNSVYTENAGSITLDWLKWKACENLQGMLSSSSAPTIQWT